MCALTENGVKLNTVTVFLCNLKEQWKYHKLRKVWQWKFFFKNFDTAFFFYFHNHWNPFDGTNTPNKFPVSCPVRMFYMRLGSLLFCKIWGIIWVAHFYYSLKIGRTIFLGTILEITIFISHSSEIKFK